MKSRKSMMMDIASSSGNVVQSCDKDAEISREKYDKFIKMIHEECDKIGVNTKCLETLQFEHFDTDDSNTLCRKEWAFLVAELEEKLGECNVQKLLERISHNRMSVNGKNLRKSAFSAFVGLDPAKTTERKSQRKSYFNKENAFETCSVSAMCSSLARRTSMMNFGSVAAVENLPGMAISEQQFSPLKDLLQTNKKPDLKAIRDRLEEAGDGMDFSLPLCRAAPPPLFFAVGIQNAQLCENLLEFKADVHVQFAGKMWQGMKTGMTPLEATLSRKAHFIGTVFETKYKKIEIILEKHIALDPRSKAIALQQQMGTSEEVIIQKHACDHFEGSPNDKYLIKQKIGEGSFGSVRLAICKESEMVRAIKTVPKVVDAWYEIDILRELDHPNLIKLYATFEDQHNLYLVMENCTGGELLDALMDDGVFDERIASGVFKQIVAGVTYLHGQKISHRDLKPDNMLLSCKKVSEALVKIVDFGTASMFDPNDASMMTKICTIHYVAPEILTKKIVPYTEKCDVWSCGVILFLLLSGSPPFYHEVEMEQMRLIKKGIYSMEDETWDDVSEDAKDLVKAMLTKNTEKRPSSSQLMDHAWLKPGRNLEAPPRQNGADIKNRLRGFKAANMLKRTALRMIASQVADTAFHEQLQNRLLSLDPKETGFLELAAIEMSVEAVINDLKYNEDANIVQAEMHFQECIQLLYEMACRTHETDGKLNWKDFFQATIDRKQELYETATRAAFDFFDADGSGTLDREELKKALCSEDGQGQLLTRGMDLNVELVDYFLSRYDTDGNEDIDFEEFQSMMAELVEMQNTDDFEFN